MKPNQLFLAFQLLVGVLLPATAAELEELIIEAHCDGGHSLHIRPAGIYWENGNAIKPGRMSTLNEPTFVNGQPWIPRWKDHPKDDIGADTSASYPVAIGTADLDFELLAVSAQRGDPGILPKSPVIAQKEKAEFVVTITDPESGARWYKFALRKKKTVGAAPVPPSEQQPSTPQGAETQLAELTQLKVQRMSAVTKALKPIDEKYAAELLLMKSRLTKAGLQASERIVDREFKDFQERRLREPTTDKSPVVTKLEVSDFSGRWVGINPPACEFKNMMVIDPSGTVVGKIEILNAEERKVAITIGKWIDTLHVSTAGDMMVGKNSGGGNTWWRKLN